MFWKGDLNDSLKADRPARGHAPFSFHTRQDSQGEAWAGRGPGSGAASLGAVRPHVPRSPGGSAGQSPGSAPTARGCQEVGARPYRGCEGTWGTPGRLKTSGEIRAGPPAPLPSEPASSAPLPQLGQPARPHNGSRGSVGGGRGPVSPGRTARRHPRPPPSARHVPGSSLAPESHAGNPGDVTVLQLSPSRALQKGREGGDVSGALTRLRRRRRQQNVLRRRLVEEKPQDGRKRRSRREENVTDVSLRNRGGGGRVTSLRPRRRRVFLLLLLSVQCGSLFPFHLRLQPCLFSNLTM